MAGHLLQGAVDRRGLTATTGGLPSNLHVWHRGNQRIFPENTMEAFKASIALGAKALKLDVCDTLDGALVAMHDTTADRTTNVSGTIANMSSAQLRAASVDAGSWFSPAWGNLPIPSLSDVLDLLGGKVVLFLEPKTLTATPLLIAEIVKRNLQSSVVVMATNMTTVAAAKAANCASQYYWIGSATVTNPTPATALSTGATQLGIGKQYTDADITTVVSAASAAGVPVFGYTLQRRVELARMQSLGVTNWFTNDVLYVSGTASTRTTDDFASGTPFHGLVPSDSFPVDGVVPYVGSPKRLAFTGAGSDGSATGIVAFALLGYLGPMPATYTLSGTVTFDSLDSDATKWAGILLVTDDRSYSGSPTVAGYNVLFRQNGQIQIFKQTPGATTNGVTASGSSAQVGSTGTMTTPATPSAGVGLPFSIQVTATQIIATIAGTVVTATDSTFRPLAYAHVGKSSTTAASQAVSFSGITRT